MKPRKISGVVFLCIILCTSCYFVSALDTFDWATWDSGNGYSLLIPSDWDAESYSDEQVSLKDQKEEGMLVILTDKSNPNGDQMSEKDLKSYFDFVIEQDNLTLQIISDSRR